MVGTYNSGISEHNYPSEIGAEQDDEEEEEEEEADDGVGAHRQSF